MIASLTWREKLPSAMAAVALQAGLFALLALSFSVVRRLSAEKETILVLPPLARSLPGRPPMVIDARRKPAPGTAAPAVSGPPTDAFSGFVPGNGSAGSGVQLARPPGIADCRPENPANLNATQRAACPPQRAAKDGQELPLHPDTHAKDQAHWAQEWEHEHDSYLPGVTADEKSIHVTLFKSDGPSLVGGYRTPDAAPPHAHSDDADVRKAMDAYHARMRVLYPRQPAGAQ